MDRFYIAIAALLGGLAAALAGYLESHEPFDLRKFGGSAVRAAIAAVIVAAGYQNSNRLTVLELFYAFLGGAGVDVLGNHVAARFGNGGFPLPLRR